MTTPITPWQRPAFRPTGRTATAMLIAFADGAVLQDLRLDGTVPRSAPVAALDLRVHAYADSPEWIDGWRTGALRTLATHKLDDPARLDAAACCYSVTVTVQDPPNLAHLQLAWAVASRIAEAGAFAVLDVHAATWWPGAVVAALAPARGFTVRDEISLIAETESAPGFGHPVHTRGLLKVGRPDLVAGVPADRIEETGRILHHLATMLADGHVLTPGRPVRVGGRRTLDVAPYAPGPTVPQLHLNNDALLLTDAENRIRPDRV